MSLRSSSLRLSQMTYDRRRGTRGLGRAALPDVGGRLWAPVTPTLPDSRAQAGVDRSRKRMSSPQTRACSLARVLGDDDKTTRAAVGDRAENLNKMLSWV